MKVSHMKSKNFIFSAAGIIGSLVFFPFDTGKAIEPPPDTAAPPADMLQDMGRNAELPLREAENTLEVPFLGLSTAPLPDMVAEHVGLENGSGLIVRTVVPSSPAAEAGLVVNDIIVKVGGQTVDSPEALSSTVRSAKIGDKMPIELIHKGKPEIVEVTLTERPADLLSGGNQDLMLEGLPKLHAEQLRKLMEKNLRGFPGEGFNREDLFRGFGFPDLQEFPDLGQGQAEGSTIQQSSTVRVMDNDGSIEIRTSDGATDVTVRDAKNETVWSGPWNTEEDKAAAPADIRQRVEKVNSGKRGFSFRFRNGKSGKPDTIDN